MFAPRWRRWPLQSATPEEGATFYGWYDCDTGESLGTDATLTVSNTDPRNISACFYSKSYVPCCPEVASYTPILTALDSAASAGDVIQLDEGVYSIGSTLTITKAITLRGAAGGGTVLKATGTGYCVLSVTGGATIERLAITGGSYPSGWGGNGRGVSITSGTLSYCTITNNTYTGAGNGFAVGVYVDVASYKTVKITHCRICDNRSKVSNNTIPGAGLYVKGNGTFRMDNCLVAANESKGGGASTSWLGGGLAITHSNAEIVNCTFVDNYHISRGGGVGIAGGTPKFINCIIARNSTDNDPCVHKPDVSASTLTTDGYISASITNVCYNNLVSFGSTVFGVDGLAADPLFKTDSYTLKIGSPCIGAGKAVEGITDGVDLDGVARDPDSVDLGCFKYVPSTDFSAKVVIGATVAFLDEEVPVTVTYYNTPAGKTLVDELSAVNATMTNALTVVDGKAVFGVPGTWSVRLVVKDGDTVLADETSATTVKIGARTLYVTSDQTAKSVYPFTSEETAATNINDVTGLCIDGTAIELDAGVHTPCAGCSFAYGVRVTGKGRDATWINAGKVNGTLFYLNNSAALVENLSITNFYRAYSGGGLYIAAGGGTVRNCRFARNRLHSASSNCSGMAVYADAALGLVENCIFEHLTYNLDDNECDGIALRLASGAQARNCLFRDIEAANGKGGDYVVSVNKSSAIDNCTFADCRAKYVSGYSSTIGFYLLRQTENGLVRNVIGCAIGEMKGDVGSSPTYGYITGYNAANVKNSCFEGETTYGSNPADGMRIRFSDQKPYHPLPDSSCHNGGMICDWMDATATDLDGNPRVTGKRVDVGCYECPAGLMLIVR